MAGTTRGPGTATPSTAAELLRETARRAPMTALLAGLVDPPDGGPGSGGPSSEPVPGELLRDRAWMAEQVRLSAARWRTDSPRVAATLWWYTASSVLLAPPLATGFLTGRSVHPGPEGLRLHLAEAGRLLGARPGTEHPAPVAGDAAGQVRDVVELCVSQLADVAGLRPHPLWAIAADALAGVLLRAGRESGRLDAGTEYALTLAERIGAPLPRPRFVDVAVPDGSDGLFPEPPPGAPATERFVRRGSCCLIYETPGEGKCASCPRRTPENRELQLELAASRMAASG